MATAPKPRHTLGLLLVIDRSATGRLEGRIRTEATDVWTTYSGVLELLKVLEELLDRHEPTSNPAPGDHVQHTHLSDLSGHHRH